MPGTDRTSSTDSQREQAAPDGLRIGEFLYNPASRKLTRAGQQVAIQRRPLSVLLYLAEHRDRVVSREELLEQFWPRASNDESLTRCVSNLRKTLGDSGDAPAYLETIWGEGYRMVARVSKDTRTGGARDQSVSGRGEEFRSGAPPTVRPGAEARASAAPWHSRPRSWRSLGLVAALLLVTALLFILRDSEQGSPHGADEIDFLAVLPIQGAFEEPWLSATLTDHLIKTVSRIEGLAVVARATAAQFSSDSDPREIGRRLGVDAVLVSEYVRREGSAGQNASLRSQLLSARDGTVLWSYEAAPSVTGAGEGQILELADAVARRLWASLQLRPAEREVDAMAYRHYLRGRYLWNQRSLDGLEAAIREFGRALAREPEYVDALTGLADAWLLMPLYGATPPSVAIPEARAAAERALALDSANARAHAVLGVVAMQFDWDWAAAERHLRRAVTLNPNDSTAVQWLGELNCYQRRFEECRRYYRQAAGLDPLSPIIRMLQGSPDLYSGNFSEAIETYRTVLRDLPDFNFTHLSLGNALAGQGDWEEAVIAYRAIQPHVGPAIVAGPLVFCLSRAGREAEAIREMQELEKLIAARYVPPSKLAVAYLGLGDRTRALAELRRAVEVYDDRLVYLAVDPFFEELRDDPVFREVLEQVGLASVLGAP